MRRLLLSLGLAFTLALMMAGTRGFDWRTGEVWAVHTAWSGNHEHLVEALPEGAGRHHAVIGGGELLAPGEVRLAPGETYAAPTVVFVHSTDATLAILGDYVPFGIGQALGAMAGGNSLDNTLRVGRLVPTEWVLLDIRVDLIAHGFGHHIPTFGHKEFSEGGALVLS